MARLGLHTVDLLKGIVSRDLCVNFFFYWIDLTFLGGRIRFFFHLS
jgi:hypothetical protein